MRTGLITHTACLEHEPPQGHPESPARLSAVLHRLRMLGLPELVAPHAPREALLRVHEAALIQAVEEWSARAKARGIVQIDADTFMSAGSLEAAFRAAGAVLQGVDSVMAGELQNAFCAVRPPGHHAERPRAMGFCLFNSVAAGAMHVRANYGLGRIAIVDFDVHHGNGTQDIFFNDPDVLYISTHQMPLYPGTGFETERGVAGNVLNRPLAPGSGSGAFRAIYREALLPALEAFAPEFVFISAGFDAHRADPLANLNLEEDDFRWVTAEICRIAKQLCGSRVVSALEGGYDLDALAASAEAHVRALIEA